MYYIMSIMNRKKYQQVCVLVIIFVMAVVSLAAINNRKYGGGHEK